MKKKIKEWKPTPTLRGRCSMFTSYYCPEEIFALAFKLCKYDQRKKEIENACKKLSVNNKVTTVMNHEFSAYDMLHFGFSMGFIMGQHYNIKDREHLPKLKNLFFNTLHRTERRKAERKGLPYIGHYQKRIEKRAA